MTTSPSRAEGESQGTRSAPRASSEGGTTTRALAGAGLLILLLTASWLLVEHQGARGLAFAGGALLALGAGALELRRQLGQRSRQGALQLEALEAIARESATLPAAARALEEASERVSVLEQRLTETHAEATRETVAVVRSGLLEFQGAMKAGIEDAARVAKEAVAPLVEEAVRNTVATSAEGAERLLERLERDAGARRESEAQHFESLSGVADRLVERIGQDADARREHEARHFESLTSAAAQLVERLVGHDAAEARQQERAASLLAGIEQAGEALGRIGQEQRESLEAASTANIERTRSLDEQAAARFESLAALVDRGSEEQSERLASFEERLAEAQRNGAAALGESLATAARELGDHLGATGEAVRGAAELVQAGGAEMTAVAEQFGASVERQREAAEQWLESLGQIEGAVDEAGRGAAAEALDRRLAATQEIFATQLEFQRKLFRQLRDLGERVDGREAAELLEESGDAEPLAESGDAFGEGRGDGSGDADPAAAEDEPVIRVNGEDAEELDALALQAGIQADIQAEVQAEAEVEVGAEADAERTQ